MNEQQINDRDAFEAALIAWWPQAEGNLNFEDGEYGNHFMNYAWWGWQASMKHQAAAHNVAETFPRWKLVPVEPTKEMVSAGQDKFEECIDYGFDSCEDGSTHEYSKISSDAPYQVFKAMLEAAPEAGK